MEALDKLLDKLGFYDLIGVLLPGITATGFSILADKIVFHIGLDKYLSTEDIFLFLIISYFVGVVLQEGGSFIMKCCDRGNKLFNYSLVPREDRRDSITEMEKEMFSKVIKKSFSEGTDPDWQMMYNFCKHSGGNTLSADKDHSVAAMSRSMGLYFAILAFCFSVSAIHNLNAYIIAAIVFLVQFRHLCGTVVAGFIKFDIFEYLEIILISILSKRHYPKLRIKNMTAVVADKCRWIIYVCKISNSYRFLKNYFT